MAESLRDQLSAAYDEEVAKEETATPPAETGTTPSQEGAEPAAVAEQPEKPGRTAGRARDEQGRLLPGPAVKPEQPAPQETVAAPQVQRPPRPSSWKKDYWEHWDKLDPKLAEYLHQREGEFAKGVSTYKNEWEQAKPLVDAVAPYMPLFQQYGINPAQQLSKYAEIHKTLALGTPEQKLATFLRIAQDYQVPVQNLFVRSQDGQVYFNQQLLAQASQPTPQQQQQPDVRQTVQQLLAEEKARAEAAAMEADTKTYPHFSEVKATMAQILEAGLAQDLPSAYQASLRLPQNSHIWDAMQKQQREQEEREKAEANRKAVEAARRNSVSPKSSTPSGAQAGAKKGLRATLEDAWDQHAGGRV